MGANVQLATPTVVRRYALPALLTLAFLFLPLRWLGGSAALGGDDTRLYFVYPWQWLQHVALPAYGGLSGFGAYLPAQQYIPLTLAFSAVQAVAPWLNLEALAFGIALSSGFLGVYATVLLLLPIEASAHRQAPAALAGVLYATAPLIATMYWSVPLSWVVGVGGAPLLLALAFTYLQGGRLSALLAFVLLGAYTAAGLAALPVALPYVAGGVVLGLTVLISGEQFRRRWAVRLALLGVTTLGANMFWLLPLGVSARMPGSFGNDALGAGASAGTTVRAVAQGQSILHTLLLLPSGEFERTFNWPSYQLSDWAQTFLPLSLLLLITIGAALLIARSAKRRTVVVLVGCVCTTMVLAYGQTVNVTPAGVALFAWLATNIPGFGMFRNFYNKFAGAYAYYYAVTVGVALAIVVARLRSRWRWALIALLTVGVALQGVPMLLGKPLYLPLVSGKGVTSYGYVGQLPLSFTEAMHTLARSQGSGRILELPLSANYWSEFPLIGPDAVYVGSSPVKIISGVDTFNSLNSFAVAGLPELGTRLDRAVRERDTATIGAILRMSGIRYLMYTAGLPAGIGTNWLRQPAFPRDRADMAALAHALGATQVATFSDGSQVTRYLFSLPSDAVLPRLFVTSQAEVVASRDALVNALVGDNRAAGPIGVGLADAFPPVTALTTPVDANTYVIAGPPDAEPVSSVQHPFAWQYRLQIAVKRPSLLVFLEPFDADWEAHIVRDGVTAGPALRKVPVDGYASGWMLSTAGQYVVTIEYWPQVLTWIAGAASGLTACAVALLVGAQSFAAVARRSEPAADAAGRRRPVAPASSRPLDDVVS